MIKRHTHPAPVANDDMNFDDWFETISRNWPDKAHKLQIKRWRAIKRVTRP